MSCISTGGHPGCQMKGGNHTMFAKRAKHVIVGWHKVLNFCNNANIQRKRASDCKATCPGIILITSTSTTSCH